jgi:hypothetical protein
MNLDIKITGVPKALVKLRLLDENVREKSLQAMKRACSLVERRAKENLQGRHSPHPYRHWVTGTLGRSIKSKVGFTGPYQITGVIGTDVPYAPYVEALPDGGYLFPALITEGPQAVKYFEEELEKIIKGIK